MPVILVFINFYSRKQPPPKHKNKKDLDDGNLAEKLKRIKFE